MFPHRKENYDRATLRFGDIVPKMQESEASTNKQKRHPAETICGGDLMKQPQRPQSQLAGSIVDAPVPPIEAKPTEPDTKRARRADHRPEPMFPEILEVCAWLVSVTASAA